MHGIVLDGRGQPLAGAVISALGSTSAFAVSDKNGRFTLRDLQSGPYLVRAHLQGYVPNRARIVQVTSSAADITIALTRVQDAADHPQVLQAGVGGDTDASQPDDTDAEGTSAIAWRLRHMPRSVLKNVDAAVIPVDNHGSFMGGSAAMLSRAAESPMRLADFIAELPVNGQVNFLTSTSFDHPQDLFSPQGGMPNGVAFVSLTAPTAAGTWAVRGGTTQGDLSSWIVAGSYSWQPTGSSHDYRAGMSYAMQRYLGSSADVLAAMADGRRNAGEMFAFDDWSITSRLNVSYGARYAHYDYLSHDLMLSPKATVTVTPFEDQDLRLRGTVSRRVVAPGAEEFELPATGMWLPQGRTFAAASSNGFRPEQINHVEIAAEQPLAGDIIVGLRAFRQHVDDQIVTTFGVALPDTTGANVGHYYVGNAGGVDAHGWGLSVSRTVTEGLHASVDYTQSDAQWLNPMAAGIAGVRLTGAVAAGQVERLRDLTTSIDSIVPYVDTHVFVIYKINSGFTPESALLGPQTGTRFDVQVSQALPFVKLSSSQWEMVVAVRNLFHEDLTDTSVYDELQVIRPPKHVLGGVTVHF